MFGRETYARIDLDNLTSNVEMIKEHSKKNVLGVVKANAYGHGDFYVTETLLQSTQNMVCVSSIDEAINLVEQGINADILIFSVVSSKMIEKYHNSQFIYTITSRDWFESVKNRGLRFHLEVNVGMNRVGIKSVDTIRDILLSEERIEGIYTHLQSPENLEIGQRQLNLFKNIVESCPKNFDKVHIGNAPVSLIKNEEWITDVRIGLGLYGYRVDFEDLKPVLSLYSTISHIDSVTVGETIGYDYTYKVEDSELFGTMPIGYADCFSMKNYKLPVHIRGKDYQIVGKICMDQTMVRIDETIRVGDQVELIGLNRTCESLSRATEDSIYLILSSLSDRIRRDYYRENAYVGSVIRGQKRIK